MSGVTIDSGVPYEPERPTREKWAELRRSTYWDYECGPPFAVRGRLSDYASAAEIAAAVTRLEELWRAHGRRMRELKRQGSSLFRQPGEDAAAHRGRCMEAYRTENLDTPSDDFAVLSETEDLQLERRSIKLWLADLRADKLPRLGIVLSGQPAAAVVASFRHRYDTAFAVAEEAWIKEVEATPIDDAAWQQELERRQQCSTEG